jgi:hypothetical protein
MRPTVPLAVVICAGVPGNCVVTLLRFVALVYGSVNRAGRPSAVRL